MWSEWFQKVRYDLPEPDSSGRTKTFRYRWRTKTGHVWIKAKRTRSDELIYNLRAVAAAIESGETIFWVEGEKDCDNLTAAGVVATSHHGGAGHVTPAQAEWFAGHAGLVALLYDVDPDGPDGSNKGAADVVLRYNLLREVGLRRDQIAVGRALVGKDVSDHLAAGHTLDELVWLEDLSELYEKAANTTRASYRDGEYRVPPNWGARISGDGS